MRIQRGWSVSVQLVICLSILLTIHHVAVAQEGEGESTPIPISTIEELQLIGNDPGYPLDGDYILTQDIDASATATWNSGEGFEPIGDSPEFTGHFNGQGHIVSALVINGHGGYSLGLFGNLSDSGIIENIGVENVSVTGSEYL